MAATRILIAEDNDLVSLTLEEQLKGLGYDVIGIARTGTEAVDLATRLSPDLILMDINMPDMDGYEVCKDIRRHPQLASLPVIMPKKQYEHKTWLPGSGILKNATSIQVPNDHSAR